MDFRVVTFGTAPAADAAKEEFKFFRVFMTTRTDDEDTEWVFDNFKSQRITKETRFKIQKLNDDSKN